MVKSTDIPAVSGFSERFAAALSKIVDDAGISRQTIADEAGRSRAFVSDQLLGKRPVDTDVITAVATGLSVEPSYLVGRIVREIRKWEEGMVASRAAEIAAQRPAPEAASTDDLAAQRQRRRAPQPAKRAARKTTKPKGGE